MVLKDADARFVSADDVHVSYDNESSQGTIRLEENSSLEINVEGLYFYTGNRVELESGSELTLTKSSASISNSGAETTTLIASNVGKGNTRSAIRHGKCGLRADRRSPESHTPLGLPNWATNSRSSLENAGAGTLTVKKRGQHHHRHRKPPAAM